MAVSEESIRSICDGGRRINLRLDLVGMQTRTDETKKNQKHGGKPDVCGHRSSSTRDVLHCFFFPLVDLYEEITS